MPRVVGPAAALSFAMVVSAAAPAGAVVQGSASSLGIYTVRLVGNGNCTGVVIARRAVVTASHCARGMRVMTGSGSVRIIGITRSIALDDGRRVQVSGDAAILRLAAPLPYGVSPAPVGDGHGEHFTIAGYGTTDERARGAFGSLHEASLVAARGRSLVDPNRSGAISASACFGDSGGPVMRGGALVGVITRANYPHKRIACGYYTRWAPIRVTGHARTVIATSEDTVVRQPRHRSRRHRSAHGQQVKQVAEVGLFDQWFAPKEKTKTKKRRSRRLHRRFRRAGL